MATNDGYSPYPIGLTAAQTVEAINRAYDLRDGDFAQYTSGLVAPTTYQPGDLWFNENNNILYRAYVENTTVVWIEV